MGICQIYGDISLSFKATGVSLGLQSITDIRYHLHLQPLTSMWTQSSHVYHRSGVIFKFYIVL